MLTAGSLLSSQKQGNLSCKSHERAVRFALLEIAVLLSGLEWVLWTDSKHVLSNTARSIGSISLATIVVALLLRQRPTRSELGFAPPRWFAGVPLLLSLTGLTMLVIWLIGTWLGTIGNVENFPHWISRNWHLEGLQQLLLQVLLVPRLRTVLGDRPVTVSAIAAIIFGLLHAPNVPLIALTVIAGFVWCEWFRRFPNFVAVWVSHFLLAATVLYCLNGPALATLRVGISYFY